MNQIGTNNLYANLNPVLSELDIPTSRKGIIGSEPMNKNGLNVGEKFI